MNGNVHTCDNSGRNKRVRVRRKVFVLAKDMMDRHHMGKYRGKCCLLKEPEAELQAAFDS